VKSEKFIQRTIASTQVIMTHILGAKIEKIHTICVPTLAILGAWTPPPPWNSQKKGDEWTTNPLQLTKTHKTHRNLARIAHNVDLLDHQLSVF